MRPRGRNTRETDSPSKAEAGQGYVLRSVHTVIDCQGWATYNTVVLS
jgi:hypothetical protein